MKKVVNCLYVHKSNLVELEKALTREQKQLMARAVCTAFREEIPYEIVKFNLENNAVSIINALEWAERYEPIVGDGVIFKADGTRAKYKGGFQVYHMKEIFVNPNYIRFDIEEAKRRTELLNALSIIKINKFTMSSLEWWSKFLEDYHLPIYMKGVDKHI